MTEDVPLAFSGFLSSLSSSLFMAPYEIGKRSSANCSLALLRFSDSFLDIHSFNGLSSLGSLSPILSSPPTDDICKQVGIGCLLCRDDIIDDSFVQS